MEKVIEKGKNDSIFEKADHLEAVFSTNSEALVYFGKRLEQICSKFNKPVEEMVSLAEASGTFNSDYSEILSLCRKIDFLKRG